MKNLFAPVFLLTIMSACISCNDCISTMPEYLSPYSSPVWHPDGNVLFFNWVPLINRHKPRGYCKDVEYTYNIDSLGFWRINKDGTNLKRALPYALENASWSPDGKWLAYNYGANIFKIAFDGQNFDTSHIVQLTNNGFGNYKPSWNDTGDSIYYESSEFGPSGFLKICKMAADGTARKLIGNKGIDTLYSREPCFINPDLVLHVRGDTISDHVYAMNANGDKVRKLTKNVSVITGIYHPNYYNNKIYYEDDGVWSCNLDGSNLKELVHYSFLGYSISKDGTIAFVLFDSQNIDRSHGVIMFMDENGNHKKQFTFNNY
ncbi:hypothetical protein QTN47_25780 [Danxiaibacter flavus]|uniref:DUF5050 domain-containing protein n=1 Tax=Danxiaibacter flavus TaxID=3049108 RepID=A0ABV3ZP45_9BACT|nr:hypothetical protein QNM32_25780 [Chitinophagaceae bacterium DXS]